MSTESVTKFFETVYSDSQLQGALNYVLLKTSPEALIALAQEKGFTFTQADLDAVAGEELSVEALDGVVGGVSSFTAITKSALQFNFYKQFTSIGGGISLDPFVKIPGPSWVNQQSFKPVKSNHEEESNSVSAVEIFQNLVNQ
jgi:predicted ribosomally synthesized peptide with nif11-like leader